MKDTTFRPGKELLPRIAPTEVVAERGGLVHGVVHDENAMALGGVAPHAGLFGTAPDLARFAQMMLSGGVLRPPAHRVARDRRAVHRRDPRAGLEPRLRLGEADRRQLRRRAPVAVGLRAHRLHRHVALDRPRRGSCSSILLTNRVHPTRENNQIRQVRRDVHDAVVRGLATP